MKSARPALRSTPSTAAPLRAPSVALLALLSSNSVAAQSSPAPPGPLPAQPLPVQPAPSTLPQQPPPPPAQPLPTSSQPPPAPLPPRPAPVPAQPPPAQPPPANSYPPYAQRPPAGQAAPRYAVAAPPPPTPASRRSRPLEIPEFSVRVDPLNWLLDGKLGFELELAALDWLTIETVPVFVTAKEPVLLTDGLRRESNGAGALAGLSLGLGFWLNGDAFSGTVLRVSYKNYAYRYSTHVTAGKGFKTLKPGEELDALKHTEQRLEFLIGSQRSWGFFTIGGGFGLEYELNQEKSCLGTENNFFRSSEASCSADEEQLALSADPREALAVDVNSRLHPFGFVARLSLGFVWQN